MMWSNILTRFVLLTDEEEVGPWPRGPIFPVRKKALQRPRVFQVNSLSRTLRLMQSVCTQNGASDHSASSAPSQQSQMLSHLKYLMPVFTCYHFKLQTKNKHLAVHVDMKPTPSHFSPAIKNESIMKWTLSVPLCYP